MKKIITTTSLCLLWFLHSSAQVLCVQSFEQNDSIGINVGANNLIMNGSFENTTCGFNSSYHSFCPNSAYYNCNITNWTCTGGGDSTYAYFWNTFNYPVVKGSRAPYFGNSTSRACSLTTYDTTCLAMSGNVVTGIPVGYPLSGSNFGDTSGISLSQTVSGLIPGNTYILEFWAGGEGDVFYSKKGLFAADVGFGNIFLRNNHTSFSSGPGTRFVIEFNATASSHTIRFTNWGHISNVCTELILDDVRLYTPQYLPPNFTICSVGINESPENNITIAPNPFTSETKITFNKEERHIIKVNDVLGKEIKSIYCSGKEYTMEKGEMEKGIYFVQITDEKKNITYKKIELQ